MQKIVLLQKRKSGSDIVAFHAALATACEGNPEIDGLNRYVQSHTLVKGYQKGELLYDAVEEFSFATDDLANRFVASPAYAAIRQARTDLIDPATSATLMVDVHRVKNRPVPAGAVKNIEFVTRRASVALADFRRHWKDVHGPLGAQIPSILRYEQNHTAAGAYREDSAPRFDGLAVTWFESTAAMRAGVQTEAYEITRADEPNFLPDGHLPIIITREALER